MRWITTSGHVFASQPTLVVLMPLWLSLCWWCGNQRWVRRSQEIGGTRSGCKKGHGAEVDAGDVGQNTAHHFAALSTGRKRSMSSSRLERVSKHPLCNGGSTSFTEPRPSSRSMAHMSAPRIMIVSKLRCTVVIALLRSGADETIASKIDEIAADGV